MEREALILRLRAEHAKLAAEYADEKERELFAQQARAYEAQAIELENKLDLWTEPSVSPAINDRVRRTALSVQTPRH
jgi:hypothetical protein